MPSVLEALLAAFPDAAEEFQSEGRPTVAAGEVLSDTAPSATDSSAVDTYTSRIVAIKSQVSVRLPLFNLLKSHSYCCNTTRTAATAPYYLARCRATATIPPSTLRRGIPGRGDSFVTSRCRQDVQLLQILPKSLFPGTVFKAPDCSSCMQTSPLAGGALVCLPKRPCYLWTTLRSSKEASLLSCSR